MKKTPLSGHLNTSIMQRVIDGSLSVASPEEMGEILAIYPDDPFLHKKHGDLLNNFNRIDEATRAYNKASDLFIVKGMNLQAVVSKILQWSICKPKHNEGRAFHALLNDKGSFHTPLQRFWARMSYSELVAFIRRLVRVRYPAGRKIVRVDDPAEELYFVVSGTLFEMPSPECESEARRAGIEVEPILLGPNDVFGDIFPLNRSTVTDADIRTVSEVELVKISKQTLNSLNEKYPSISKSLQGLRKPENRENCDRSWQTVRRSMRYGLPTKAEISLPDTGYGPQTWRQTGIAIDLSMSGMCLDLGDAKLPDKKGLKGRFVEIKLDLLAEVAELNISGVIVWQASRKKLEKSATLIGIRFDTLNPMDQDMLTEYCSGNVGEENLLWSLWETMVRTDHSD